MDSAIKLTGSLQADHIRNGLIIDTRISGPREPNGPAFQELKHSSWFRRLLNGMLDSKGRFLNRESGIVTTAGVNFMAAAFAGGAAISGFNYHDSGNGGTSYGSSSSTVTGMTANAVSPVVVTLASHGLLTNDIVLFDSTAAGETALNGFIWCVINVSSSTFSCDGSTGNGTWTSGGTFKATNTHSDTVLTAQAGPTTRATGVQTQPGSVNIYKSVGTINYVSSLAITEWGLFSQSAQGGTLWDRRWLNTVGAPQNLPAAALTAAPINVINGDSIAFSYSLTCSPGGS